MQDVLFAATWEHLHRKPAQRAQGYLQDWQLRSALQGRMRCGARYPLLRAWRNAKYGYRSKLWTYRFLRQRRCYSEIRTIGVYDVLHKLSGCGLLMQRQTRGGRTSAQAGTTIENCCTWETPSAVYSVRCNLFALSCQLWIQNIFFYSDSSPEPRAHSRMPLPILPFAGTPWPVSTCSTEIRPTHTAAPGPPLDHSRSHTCPPSTPAPDYVTTAGDVPTAAAATTRPPFPPSTSILAGHAPDPRTILSSSSSSSSPPDGWRGWVGRPTAKPAPASPSNSIPSRTPISTCPAPPAAPHQNGTTGPASPVPSSAPPAPRIVDHPATASRTSTPHRATCAAHSDADSAARSAAIAAASAATAASLPPAFPAASAAALAAPAAARAAAARTAPAHVSAVGGNTSGMHPTAVHAAYRTVNGCTFSAASTSRSTPAAASPAADLAAITIEASASAPTRVP